MGLGDALLAVGEAEVIFHATGDRVAIGKSRDRLVYSPMELYCPWVIQHGEDPSAARLLQNYPGHRPYIDYKRCRGGKQVLFSKHRAVAGRLFFSEDENADSYRAIDGFEKGIILAPHIKGTFSGPNKAWPMHHWQTLLDLIHDSGRSVIHCGPPDKPALARADLDLRLPVRPTLAAMRWAGAVVTSEGLMHHAAAGMSLPAVVLWGERTDPRVLGYAGHANLANRINGEWCGKLRYCDHCERAMEGTSPDLVMDALERIL